MKKKLITEKKLDPEDVGSRLGGTFLKFYMGRHGFCDMSVKRPLQYNDYDKKDSILRRLLKELHGLLEFKPCQLYLENTLEFRKAVKHAIY